MKLIEFVMHSLGLCGFTNGLSLEIVCVYYLLPVAVSFFCLANKPPTTMSGGHFSCACLTVWHTAAL